MAEDTTYLQNLRGAAAQAAACFENKIARDPIPKEEVAYALLTRALVVARTTAEAQRDTLLGYTPRHTEPATSAEGGAVPGTLSGTEASTSSGSATQSGDGGSDSDDSVTIFGQEVTNTFTKLANSDDPAKTILDDCIPCMDRALDMDLMAPLDDLLDDLEAEFDVKLDMLRDLWGLLNSDDFYEDLCDLLDFFSFMCVPDLVAILSMLIWYYQSLITSFQIDINGSLWSLIGMMIGPMMTSLEGIIDQYIQMIMAPIDCIITMVLFQMSKIPQIERDYEFLLERSREREKLQEQETTTSSIMATINEAIDSRLNSLALSVSPWYQSERSVVKYREGSEVKTRGTATPLPKVKTRRDEDGNLQLFTSDFDYEPSEEEVAAVPDSLEYLEDREKTQEEQATVADYLSDARISIESGLGALGAYLIEGRDRMNSWFETLKEELRGFLFDSADTFSLATSLATTIKRLSRLIGFVKAIIRIAEEGLECGPDGEVSTPELIQLVEAATADDPTVEVVVEDDGTITIVPIDGTARVPPSGTGLAGRGAALAQDAPLLEGAERESTTITLSDCVNKVDIADLRKVEAWIKEISK